MRGDDVIPDKKVATQRPAPAGPGSPGAAPSIMHRNFNEPPGHHDGAMNPPSRATLAVFSASLKLMDDETLAELRGRFVALGEHAAGIRAMDREIARRRRAGSQ